MSKLSFYNDNMFRAYPFVRNPTIDNSALDAAIVDAGFILAPEVLYDANNDRIFLTAVTLSGNALFFNFGFARTCSDGRPEASSVAFTQNVDAPEFTPAAIVENYLTLCVNKFAPEEFPPPSNKPKDERIKTSVCDGFLVTGNLSALAAFVAAAGGSIGLAYEVEPARIQNLNKAYVSTVCVANVKRLTVPACKLDETCVPPFNEEEEEEQTDCIKFVIDSDPAEPVDPIYVPPAPANECDYDAMYPLICDGQIIFADNYCIGCGTIIFNAGANVRITQSTELNSITLTPGVTSGLTTHDETLCDYNGEIPFTEKEAVAFAKNEDEAGKALSIAVPPFWKDAPKDLYEELKPPIYIVADKEDPTNIDSADIKRSNYLSGGPPCKGLITTINGVSAANVNIIAGANIQIGARASDDDECRQVMVVKLTDTARGNCDVQ